MRLQKLRIADTISTIADRVYAAVFSRARVFPGKGMRIMASIGVILDSPRRIIRFRQFALDVSTNELRRCGIRLKAHGQPIAILKMLLEHPGETISRESLRYALWSDHTFVEFEHGLNSSINRLRAVLGDHAAIPRFIETVPGLGYRFIAAIDGVPGDGHKRMAIRVAVPPFTGIGDSNNLAEMIRAETAVLIMRLCPEMTILLSASPNGHSGRRIHADYVLAGAIWRNAPAIRVCVQLLRAADSCCTWGATYACSEADVFSVVDRLAAEVSPHLHSAWDEAGVLR